MFKDRPRHLRALAGAAVFVISGASHAAIRRVDGTVSLSGNGSTWPLAFKTIQEAVSVAGSGDEIWVADGTYKPANQGTSIDLKSGVNIKGGYIGNNGAISPDTRDPDVYITILSGDVDNDNIFDSDNADRIVRAPDGTQPPTQSGNYADQANLDGFKITGAWGTIGGGIFVTTTTQATAVVIRDCEIYNNLSGAGGGFNGYGESNVILRKCDIHHNSAVEGGGVICQAGTLTLVDCNVHENSSSNDGAGVKSFGELTIVNSTITDNNSGNAGGGISVKSVDGAVKLINCLIADNTAVGNGGGVELASGSVTLEMTNCTLSANSADAGGGLWLSTSSVNSFIKNSIFWDNVATPDPEISTSDTLTVTYSDIETPSVVWPGTGNIGNNPAHNPDFVNPPSDYRLQCGSPCIGIGSNAAVLDDTLDANEDAAVNPTYDDPIDRDLTTRIIETTVDMGAYEKIEQATCYGDVVENCVVDVDDLLLIINNWADTGGDADVTPLCGNGVVDVDDLLVIINNWGPCPGSGCVDTTGVTMQDADDCMDAASLEYEPFSAEWDDFVNKCVEGLRAAGLIE